MAVTYSYYCPNWQCPKSGQPQDDYGLEQIGRHHYRKVCLECGCDEIGLDQDDPKKESD